MVKKRTITERPSVRTLDREFWHARDRRARNVSAASSVDEVLTWLDTNRPSAGDPGEEKLFISLHAAAYQANRARRLSQTAQARSWARKWYAIRDYLVDRNIPLVYSMIGRIRSPQVDGDDLLSEAFYALVQAVERFDPWRGFRFSTYAWHAIQRSTIRSRKQSSRYRRLLQMEQQNAPQPEFTPGDRGLGLYLERLQRVLDHNLGELTDLEWNILSRRFPFGDEPRCTLQEVGDEIGFSKERVRQIQKSALGKLRDVLETDPVLQ